MLVISGERKVVIHGSSMSYKATKYILTEIHACILIGCTTLAQTNTSRLSSNYRNCLRRVSAVSIVGVTQGKII